MKKMEKSYCNSIIYCYVEEQKDELKRFISKYNDEDIIHIISSVIESCDGKILYCLCDIITNYIETSKEQETGFYFVTDIRGLYDIVKKLYSAIFEDIIYISQGNNKEFDEEFETDEFINYFLNIQRSKLHSSFMRQLWNLKNCQDKNSFMKFLYELEGLDIEKENYLKKLWHCLGEILLYEAGYTEVKNNCFIYKLAIYSILMRLDKNVDYTNIYLSEILKSDEIEAQNMYFAYHQFKRMSLKKLATFDKKSNLLIDELYEKIYNRYAEDLNQYYTPLEERNKNLVMILTIQFLDETHAPTKTVIERASALKKLGKEVVIVNTTEQYIKKGYLPMYKTGFGRVLGKYDKISQIQIGDKLFPFMQMPENSPMEYRMQVLSEIIKKYKPYYILSIGTGSILADLCGNIVPCASMALAFSTLPKTKNKMKILGRKLSEEEKKVYANEDIDIIESKFTFELKPQKNKLSRKKKGLPDGRFLLVVVGIRLEFEVSDAFMSMLSDVCSKGCYVVFAGIMDNYNTLMEQYPFVAANSSFIGYCDDILALMEICDLYVNPDRLGGGFSIIEAFSKGVPGVYLKSGDVYTAGGKNFSVNDFGEMVEQILRYKDDKDYYNKMSEIAKERAKLMTSSEEAIADIDRQICQRIEEKYW
ncbi:MAG: hypothetical protein OSJ45_09900 [Lachnospiraceae bacterium]|nr:hypothetical protein [Lachnospiraceae bacterium]